MTSWVRRFEMFAQTVVTWVTTVTSFHTSAMGGNPEVTASVVAGLPIGRPQDLGVTEVTEVTELQRLHDLYEERAAICEYEGGLSRQEAERQAYWEVYGWIDHSSLPPSDSWAHPMGMRVNS